ncbi:Nif3-like dinuclear metal center hexameric protein [candidate division KSB1 bacterium]|nr:Nif3-like dinuclear metal center hexameric protein [candidate division KSB1 bacterium]
MANRDDIIKFVDSYLDVTLYKDYCPQGLQVEGKDKVEKIITAVSASLELFDNACQSGTDMIIVHHGILWDAESRVIKKSFKARVKRLLDDDITLLAYHLPLDKHHQIGNNILAASALELTDIGDLNVGIYGRITELPFEILLQKIRNIFTPNILYFAFGPEFVRRVGFCSGGGSGELALAIEKDCDVFNSGELKEPVMHLAKEAGIHAVAAGHYATEVLGVRALGQIIQKHFNVDVDFIDIPNPL